LVGPAQAVELEHVQELTALTTKFVQRLEAQGASAFAAATIPLVAEQVPPANVPLQSVKAPPFIAAY